MSSIPKNNYKKAFLRGLLWWTGMFVALMALSIYTYEYQGYNILLRIGDNLPVVTFGLIVGFFAANFHKVIDAL